MPESFSTVVYVIANIFIYLFVLLAVQVNCKSKLGRWQTLLVDLASFIGATIVWTLPFLSLIRTLVGFAYIILVVQLLHKDTWVFKLVAASTSYLAMLLADAVFGLMIPRDAAVSGELMQRYPIPFYAALVFVNLVMQSINIMFVRFLSKRGGTSSGRLQGLLLLTFPISQLAAVWLYFSAYQDMETIFSPWAVLPVVLIYLIADIALYFSLRISEKNAKILARTEVLEEEIAIQKDYHTQLANSYEQIRKLRHDIDSHLYTIQTMLDAGQTEEAAQYAREVFEQESAVTIFASCKNTVVAAFLEKRKEDFEASGMLLDCDIHLPRETGISNADLICAFGNILNNAQEACEELTHPTVELRVHYQEPYLSILCENPVGKTDNERKKKISGMERGLGLLILEDLAKQYDGELQANAEGEKFRTQLVLKGGTQNA